MSHLELTLWINTQFILLTINSQDSYNSLGLVIFKYFYSSNKDTMRSKKCYLKLKGWIKIFNSLNTALNMLISNTMQQ